jgi:uncharacterized protein YjbI with pentapeptide repeats
LLVISPCAGQDDVDHDIANQASIINFIEYNWGITPIPGSYDQAEAAIDHSEGIPFDLAGMFNFTHCDAPAVQLDPATGRVDLRGAEMANASLNGHDFSAAEFAGADLGGASLVAAFMPAAGLQGATLTKANLARADLWGANLSNADLAGANLTGADLRDANLSGALLDGAIVSGVNWSNAICPDGTKSASDGGTCASNLRAGPRRS